jgi:hypothetical protein
MAEQVEMDEGRQEFSRTLDNGMRVHIDAPKNWRGLAILSWTDGGGFQRVALPALFVKRLIDAEDRLFKTDCMLAGEEKSKAGGQTVFRYRWKDDVKRRGYVDTKWLFTGTGPLRNSVSAVMRRLDERDRERLRVVKFELHEIAEYDVAAFWGGGSKATP